MTHTFQKRADIEVLTRADAVYRVLVPLQIEQTVPEQCYILDYQNGTIPLWQVYQREQDDTLVVLVLIDRNASKQATLFEPQQWVARQVLASPGKVLATPIYIIGLDGAGPKPMLCDLIQQARAVAKQYTMYQPDKEKERKRVRNCTRLRSSTKLAPVVFGSA